MAKKSRFFSGVVLGAVVGAAAALLASPKKSNEFREGALNKFNEIKADPQAALNDFKDLSVDKFTEIKDKFDSGEYSVDRARDFLIEKRDLIREKVDSGELSLDTVIDFFDKTREQLKQRFNPMDKASEEELIADYSWTEDE